MQFWLNMRRRWRVAGTAAAGTAIAGMAVGVLALTTTAQSAVAKANSASASASAASGFAQARAIVAKYEKLQPAPTVPKLSRRPPAGKKVDWVFCTSPVCQATVSAPAFKALHWHFKVVPVNLAQGPAGMATAMTQALQGKPNYIGLAGVFPDSTITSELKQAKAEHIPVVQITGAATSSAVVGCVSCATQLEATGKLEVDIALADAGAKTQMVYMEDPTNLGFTQGLAGAEKEAKRIGGGSTVTPLKISETDPAATTAQTVVSYLEAHPDVKYVLSGDADVGLGLPSALASAGIAGRVKLIFAAPQATDLNLLKTGAEFAEVGEENAMAHWSAANILARLAIGAPVPKSLTQPVGWLQIINKKNVGDFPQNVAPQPLNYQKVFERAWRVH
jgi:ribose transport system substrate-binding protein